MLRLVVWLESVLLMVIVGWWVARLVLSGFAVWLLVGWWSVLVLVVWFVPWFWCG